MNDELYYYMKAHEVEDAPDGAWWAILENSVMFYNKENGTKFDEFEMVQEFINYEPANKSLNAPPTTAPVGEDTLRTK